MPLIVKGIQTADKPLDILICTPKVGLNNQLIKVQIFMAKYTQSFKQQMIEFYLQHDKNRSLTRQHFQLHETILRYWNPCVSS